MMQCIIVDDEPLALDLMRDYVGKLPFLSPIAFCDSPLEAMQYVSQTEVDLMFIDIQMPEMNGFELIQSLPRKPLVILTTAYEQFAVQSYDFHVVDYLLKPIEFMRFVHACNKASEIHKHLGGRRTYQKDFFFIPQEYSLVKVMFGDILWLEGVKDYTRIHLKAPARPLLMRRSLKSTEEDLPPPLFMRIHKSYIVRVDAITSIRKNSIFINDIELSIGETYKSAVDAMINRKS